MAYALAAVVVLICAGVIMVVLGSRLPRDHVATVRAVFAASPDAIWAVIADPYSAPSWRKDVKKVERRPDASGKESWAETTSSGVVTFELVESVPPRRRVARITDESLPFGGQWEFELASVGAGTELTITERGFVRPALFRFLARYAFGFTATMRDYLVALGVRLGEQAKPTVLATGT